MKRILYGLYLIAIPLMDINDLIRGWWFYNNWGSVIFWNIIFAISLFLFIKGGSLKTVEVKK